MLDNQIKFIPALIVQKNIENEWEVVVHNFEERCVQV